MFSIIHIRHSVPFQNYRPNLKCITNRPLCPVYVQLQSQARLPIFHRGRNTEPTPQYIIMSIDADIYTYRLNTQWVHVTLHLDAKHTQYRVHVGTYTANGQTGEADCSSAHLALLLWGLTFLTSG